MNAHLIVLVAGILGADLDFDVLAGPCCRRPVLTRRVVCRPHCFDVLAGDACTPTVTKTKKPTTEDTETAEPENSALETTGKADEPTRLHLPSAPSGASVVQPSPPRPQRYRVELRKICTPHGCEMQRVLVPIE
ncbi:hypothetical protein Pan216_30160 [Planctomycetes bacterium Pan216]|uniref:Uncharacterized protein n=1 Tax=Kolteria novifilia TaxID=2527975 RepID=A0A518B596_9BACT|nr:hypothetical protein Pan216_30160 [Planctomycetes bacterium Pan216]